MRLFLTEVVHELRKRVEGTCATIDEVRDSLADAGAYVALLKSRQEHQYTAMLVRLSRSITGPRLDVTPPFEGLTSLLLCGAGEAIVRMPS